MKHIIIAVACAAAIAASDALASGDAAKGEQAFRACAACHSLEPGRHKTGPSLADTWGRKAGTIEDFPRYSSALEESGVVWNEETLDAWLEDPRAFIPGNRMIFRGIPREAQRQDLIAFLRQATSGEGGTGRAQAGPAGRDEPPPDLGELGPRNQVTGMSHCGDSYTVATAAGESHQFWEFNLRFKTDGSDQGPAPGKPVLIPGGMMGDRAFIVFAAPQEISGFIGKGC